MNNTATLRSLGLTTALSLIAPGSAAVLSGSNNGNSLLQAIAWQTFENSGDNNNSGISDSTPDNNSTYDSTPVGSNNGGFYLVGGLGGASGSSLLRQGYGQATSSSFLQGPSIGNSVANGGLNIVDIPDAGVDGLSGTPGTRQNLQGNSGSSWKFRTNGNQEFGDFSITNASDYSFRLERVHFDARVGGANSPNTLDFVYLSAGISNLVRADNGNEVGNLSSFGSSTTFGSAPGTINKSTSLANALGTAVRLAPGDSAVFRFRWTNSGTDSGESQLDNIGFSGTFQDQNNGFALIDPAAVVVPEPSSVLLLTIAMSGLLIRQR
jgi:hypothetical protein